MATSSPQLDRKPPPEETEPYPPEAIQLVGEGLAFTIDRTHGPLTPAHRFLAQMLESENLSWEDLQRLYAENAVSPRVRTAIERIGGPEKLNRHVSGSDLCWGLRDLALERWGMLARLVLEKWNIRATVDFGRIVFNAIDRGMMQKQPRDRLEDFEDVYDFDTAFDTSHDIEI